jgi:hypothetical protein
LKINLDYSRVFQNQPKREGRGAVRFRVPPWSSIWILLSILIRTQAQPSSQQLVILDHDSLGCDTRSWIVKWYQQNGKWHSKRLSFKLACSTTTSVWTSSENWKKSHGLTLLLWRTSVSHEKTFARNNWGGCRGVQQ